MDFPRIESETTSNVNRRHVLFASIISKAVCQKVGKSKIYKYKPERLWQIAEFTVHSRFRDLGFRYYFGLLDFSLERRLMISLVAADFLFADIFRIFNF